MNKFKADRRDDRDDTKQTPGNRKTRRRSRARSKPNSYREDAGSSRPSNARNDLSWYSKYPELLVAAGSFPYPYRPGSTLEFDNTQSLQLNSEGKTQTNTFSKVIPGVLSLRWIPAIGNASVATDPASVVGKEIYSRVRSVFSGSLDADGPDYVIYLLALDSIFTYIAHLKRIYRTLSAWTPMNYQLPEALLYAYGVTNPADIAYLRAHKMQFWQNINELVLQSRKFTCPAIMDMFNRHYWMSDNVYTDAPTINSQLYVFRLGGVYSYTPINSDGVPSTNGAPGVELKQIPVSAASGSNIVDDMFNFGLSLINALVAWDDSYTISGYLRKAYDGAPQFIVDEIPQGDMLVPQYVEEVLTQIENSRALHQAGAASIQAQLVTIGQDVATNAIVANYRLFMEFNLAASFIFTKPPQPMLSMRSDVPTVADNVVASRLLAVAQYSQNSTNTKRVDITNIEAATEIPLEWTFVSWNGSSFDWFIVPTLYVGTGVNLDVQRALFSLQEFDWHPFSYVLMYSGTVGGSLTGHAHFQMLGDTHNVALLSNKDLVNLHKVCLYSELNAFTA